ncbi:MAG TPA: transposase zinc-binding domain-containing protein, partial [Kofleriaceae bacterium]|nr:transposase zinc-binding domain-containing protein [Kofleriaceae bacterium]
MCPACRRAAERELRSYLACGDLARGFGRVRCGDCGFDRLVAFVRGRAVYPSCRGRRMVDLAAHLVDRVLPPARYRQWTLSLPWRLRPRLAR